MNSQFDKLWAEPWASVQRNVRKARAVSSAHANVALEGPDTWTQIGEHVAPVIHQRLYEAEYK